MSEERFDELDCAGRRTGRVITRETAHATGAWHGAFHCLLLYPRQGRATVLLQQRSVTKRIAPGSFDVSAGGHYEAGEDADSAGPRELREELGLSVPFERLVPLGRRVFVFCFSPGLQECEIQDVFLLPMDDPPAVLAPQQEEVDALVEMDLEQGIDLLAGRRPAAEAAVLAGGAGARSVTLSTSSFVPCLDRYHLRLLLLAQRYDRGERDALAI